MSEARARVTWHASGLSRAERASLTGLSGATVWCTGLPASGKSTLAAGLERALVEAGRPAYFLDGDNLRHGLNTGLGFSRADRAENVRRVGEVALLLADAGVVAIASLVSPYAAERERVREAHGARGVAFVEVWVATGLDVCEARDPKGLYAAARRGEITGFTGIDDPYEVPAHAEVVVEMNGEGACEAAVARVSALLAGLGA